VKILSEKLFKNMQTEFREKERLKSENIRAETSDFIRRKNLGIDHDY
jgi:hypothetical protein